MILYLDTGALVKLYVEEEGTAAVAARVEQADGVATARIAYPEARAAFARHHREGGITGPALRVAVRELEREWAAFSLVEVSEMLVRGAGALAERHALRGYGAVHLGAALDVRRAGGDVEFASFDAQLNLAARRERLRLSAF